MKNDINMLRPVWLMALCHILLVTFAACEQDVDFKSPAVEAEDSLTVNSIAVEGEPLRVFLNYTYPIGRTPSLQYLDYSHAVFYRDDASTDYQTFDYYKTSAILDGEVQAVVNGQQAYSLTLAEDSMGYVCGYRPKADDRITIRARHGSSEATAETLVPALPVIEITGHEILSENPYMEINGLRNMNDTVMRVTCRIRDGGGERYYRLRVRGEREGIYSPWNYTEENGTEYNNYKYYIMQDIYFSDDDVFVDNRLSRNFGGWPAYFSNVFDNSLLRGTERIITVDSPKPVFDFTSFQLSPDKLSEEGPDFDPRVMVELQAISPELYRYLKSVQLYRVAENDAFSEPVQIYSNVKNGWGIFGSLSSSRVFIPYD